MIIRVIKLHTMEKTINILFVIFIKKIQTSLVDLKRILLGGPVWNRHSTMSLRKTLEYRKLHFTAVTTRKYECEEQTFRVM